MPSKVYSKIKKEKEKNFNFKENQTYRSIFETNDSFNIESIQKSEVKLWNLFFFKIVSGFIICLKSLPFGNGL